MTDHPTDPLELLAVTLVDMRATIETQRRAVTDAQSSVEQFRHTKARDSLEDIADCLKTMADENRDFVDEVVVAENALDALIASVTGS